MFTLKTVINVNCVTTIAICQSSCSLDVGVDGKSFRAGQNGNRAKAIWITTKKVVSIILVLNY